MREIVGYEIRDGIAVVAIDNPPINAMNRDVRAGLKRSFEAMRANSGIKAVVIGCKGKTFVAGADIKEFDTGIDEPGYHDLFRLVEDSPVPVVAAVHGTALGAGTELGLACHYRVAEQNARFGLPELTLGIIPGAGGTQRLPRVIPLESALDMILSSKPIAADGARKLGLVDAVVSGDVVEGAVAFARDLIGRGGGVRRSREQPIKGAVDAKEVLAAKSEVARRMRNRQSPAAVIEAVQAAVELPFDQGLRAETEISDRLLGGTEARALRHLFFAEREVRKIPGISPQVKPRPVRRVGLVGAGTMGGQR